jgi:hypothetical protein
MSLLTKLMGANNQERTRSEEELIDSLGPYKMRARIQSGHQGHCPILNKYDMYTGTGVIIVILALGGSKMVRVLTREICRIPLVD